MTLTCPVRALALLLIGAALAAAGNARARDVLGVFEGWGAFRDPNAQRCFAMAQPMAGGWEASPWRPFAAIGYWPRAGLRGQVNIRLSHQLAKDTHAVLSLGGRQFALVGSEADVWAADAASDAAIIAAMRTNRTMSISGRARAGGRFTDRYALGGAATAIDAAALACARRR
ncbi:MULTISPECIES: hypothetical protein [unclassified Sphingobium]|uniref:hypothetical protein n=1 Tax=unclassified Sphingobium TaxID=2611147 RepID=UPI0022248960|nr:MULTISPECIES: hypothetical protein [unclassified Sphingobium]MCW2414617.1 hypothetical protein [Sphingobium sp. B8D3A]